MLGKKGVLVIIGLLLAILIASLLSAFNETKSIVAIETALKTQWDKPNHPLRVPVIVVHGNYAIADWIEEPRGGRALLFYNNSIWQTIFCGGINMKQVSNLMSVGVPHIDAEKLAAALDKKEKRLSDTDKALIDSFKGIVDLLKEQGHHEH